jgi:uncharacterized protein with PQ loop repeat
MDLKSFLGILFTVLFLLGPCFQLAKLISSKDSKGVSAPAYWLNNMGQLCVLIYAQLTHSGLWVYINSVGSITLNCTILIFIWLYDRRKVL